MTRRKTLSIIAGVVVLGSFFYLAVWPFVVGEGRMQTFCQSLEKNATVARVRSTVEQHQYRMTSPDKAGLALIHDPRSFGRFICEVQFKEERLASMRYQHND